MLVTLFLSAAAAIAPLATQTADIQPPAMTGPTSDAAQANAGIASAAAGKPDLMVRPEDQAADDADLAYYQDALRANRQAEQLDAALTARQERAYADAMRAWRIQVADCRRGRTAACRAPTPRPADFW